MNLIPRYYAHSTDVLHTEDVNVNQYKGTTRPTSNYKMKISIKPLNTVSDSRSYILQKEAISKSVIPSGII